MTMGTRIAVMKDGILQQVDSPQVLYDTPANIFVAGFIGSPAMNFMNATLMERDGKMSVDCGDFALDVPEDKASAYRPYLGQEVVFGIRPEDTHDPEYAPPSIESSLVEAKVDVTELMGNEVIVYLVTDKNEFLGRFDPRTGAQVGNTIQVAFNMDRMHIFDKQTEKAVR
jgi:multiple sugar transport system ATP-binding protein